MEQKQITYLLIGLALIIALIGSYFVVKLPAPEIPPATGTAALISGAPRLVVGSNTITGTLNVTHGLTTPLYALYTLGQDPVATEEASCTTAIAGSTVTVKVWKTTQAAGDSGVTVFWLVAGTP